MALKTGSEDMKPRKARAGHSGAADGRKIRSERSRRKIIDALLKLVRAGDVGPSAARVADAARVSLRTVFRHFEDMDSLYREMALQCEAEFLPTFMRPYESSDWKGRLAEQCARRMKFFEDVMFLRACTEARRHQSNVLMEDYRRLFRLERSGLEAILPDKVKCQTDLVEALDVALCFETYRRLRQESGLSPDKTRVAIARWLDIIIAEAES